MSQVEILSLLDSNSYDIAIFSTYNFDPIFFEKRLLRSKGLAKARRIMIFMDASQYQQLLTSNLSLNAINHRYLVIPISVSSGVFHSKLSIFMDQIGGQILCGSGNLTQMGYTHNLELVNKVPITVDYENNLYENIDLLKSSINFYNQILPYANEEYEGIANKWLKELPCFIPWIQDLNKKPSDLDSPKLITTFSGNIWGKIIKELAGKNISKVTAISPFFDKELYMLKKIAQQWPKAKIDLISQQNTGNLDSSHILKSGKNITLYELLVPEHRRLHAKLLSFRFGQKCLAVAGSANLTKAALLNGNIETCFFFYLPSKSIEELFKKDIKKKKMSPADFESGNETPPKPADEDMDTLQLHSCIQISDDSINIVYSVSFDNEVDHLSCEIMNSIQMKPLCSIQMPFANDVRKKSKTLKISKNITSQFQGTVLCRLTATIKGKRILSVPSWLVQELSLTYTPSGYDPSSASEREIRETGSGLIEALDARIQEEGIASTIDYLNNLNIPFHGEKGKGRVVRNILKYRNPHQNGQEVDWSTFFQNDADGLKEALSDFVDRHQHKVLHKHANAGNINGLGNFIDVFETCNRLLYVYGKREVISKFWVVGKITENIAIFTSGKETRNEAYNGFLKVIYYNFGGDHEFVSGELLEMKVFEHLYSSLFISQMVRKEYHYEDPDVDPFTLLPTEQKQVDEMLEYSGLAKPPSEAIIGLLNYYNYLGNEEEEWGNILKKNLVTDCH